MLKHFDENELFTKRKTVFQYIKEYLSKGPCSPYDFYKFYKEYNKKFPSYNTVKRYFSILKRLGLIVKEKEIKYENHHFINKKSFYRLTTLKEFINNFENIKDMILDINEIKDIYYNDKLKFEDKMKAIMEKLWNNPQIIWKSYRNRNKYKSAEESKKEYRKKKNK